jgi:putative ABC transport system substrate-binding protein
MRFNHLRRREVIVLLGAAAIVGTQGAAAQKAPKMARIGMLGISSVDPALRGQFKEGLAQFDYTEGSNLVINEQHAENRLELMPERAAELVRFNPAVIFARGAAAVAATRKATTTIPIVAVDLESDPIAMGFVKSLARPGGNITGVFLDLPELSGKQLQLLREVAPRISRVGILGDPVLNAAQFAATKVAARTLAIELKSLDLKTPEDFAPAFNAARNARADAVVLLSSPLVFNYRKQIADVAIASQFPAVSMFVEFAEAGGLLAYGPSLRLSFRRCGGYVGKILQGARPEELPVERPEKFELVINLKTAKTLGIDMPGSLLARADDVIE